MTVVELIKSLAGLIEQDPKRAGYVVSLEVGGDGAIHKDGIESIDVNPFGSAVTLSGEPT
jgi:hypothetical protein